MIKSLKGCISDTEIMQHLKEVTDIANIYFGPGMGQLRLGLELYDQGREELAEYVLMQLANNHAAGGYAHAARKILGEKLLT